MIKPARDKDTLTINDVYSLTKQNASVDAKLFATLERLATLFKASTQQVSKRYRLTPLQLQVLLFVSEHQSDLCTVSYLAHELLVTKATISDSVRVLVEKDILRRHTNPNDSRAFSLSLSKKGKELYDTIKTDGAGLCYSASDLQEEQKVVLLDLLLTLLQKNFDRGAIPVRTCKTCVHYAPTSEGFHCQLLNRDLSFADLRLDCPEHESNEGQ